jgi:hypothetical protein
MYAVRPIRLSYIIYLETKAMNICAVSHVIPSQTNGRGAFYGSQLPDWKDRLVRAIV